MKVFFVALLGMVGSSGQEIGGARDSFTRNIRDSIRDEIDKAFSGWATPSRSQYPFIHPTTSTSVKGAKQPITSNIQTIEIKNPKVVSQTGITLRIPQIQVPTLAPIATLLKPTTSSLQSSCQTVQITRPISNLFQSNQPQILNTVNVGQSVLPIRQILVSAAPTISSGNNVGTRIIPSQQLGNSNFIAPVISESLPLITTLSSNQAQESKPTTQTQQSLPTSAQTTLPQLNTQATITPATPPSTINPPLSPISTTYPPTQSTTTSNTSSLNTSKAPLTVQFPSNILTYQIINGLNQKPQQIQIVQSVNRQPAKSESQEIQQLLQRIKILGQLNANASASSNGIGNISSSNTLFSLPVAPLPTPQLPFPLAPSQPPQQSNGQNSPGLTLSRPSAPLAPTLQILPSPENYQIIIPPYQLTQRSNNGIELSSILNQISPSTINTLPTNPTNPVRNGGSNTNSNSISAGQVVLLGNTLSSASASAFQTLPSNTINPSSPPLNSLPKPQVVSVSDLLQNNNLGSNSNLTTFINSILSLNNPPSNNTVPLTPTNSFSPQALNSNPALGITVTTPPPISLLSSSVSTEPSQTTVFPTQTLQNPSSISKSIDVPSDIRKAMNITATASIDQILSKADSYFRNATLVFKRCQSTSQSPSNDITFKLANNQCQMEYENARVYYQTVLEKYRVYLENTNKDIPKTQTIPSSPAPSTPITQTVSPLAQQPFLTSITSTSLPPIQLQSILPPPSSQNIGGFFTSLNFDSIHQ